MKPKQQPARIARRMAEIEPFHVMERLARARELETQGRSIIHMEIGEPDFPTPEPVLRAGMKALESGRVFYTPTPGLPQLREMAGNARLTHAQHFLNFDDRELLLLQEQEEPEPGFVGQEAQRFYD